MKVLINAYAVCPGMGSEPGMGWNWVSNLARYCECHVITESEFREQIEAAVAQLPWGSNLHFYWNPVSPEVRKMCWNQGDWRFYKYYRQWQKKTVEMASEIVCKEKIDILHQLNMIGFREPGYLWEVSKETGIPFVWGPIGGLKQFPLAYADCGGMKMKLFFMLKNFINTLQLRFDPRVNAAFKQASLLISSIPDSYKAIKKVKGMESVIIPETGCFLSSDADALSKKYPKEVMDIIWAGKFDFRKRLDIAIKSIAKADNPMLRLHVYGGGNGDQEQQTKDLAEKCGVNNQIFFHGNQPHEVVEEAMKKSDLFLFTSVNEDTSTVVLEALECCLPVVCFDTCGMAYVIDDQVGIKVPLTNPDDSIERIASIINRYYTNWSLLEQQSRACCEKQKLLSWDEKGKNVAELYKSIQ